MLFDVHAGVLGSSLPFIKNRRSHPMVLGNVAFLALREAIPSTPIRHGNDPRPRQRFQGPAGLGRAEKVLHRKGHGHPGFGQGTYLFQQDRPTTVSFQGDVSALTLARVHFTV